MADINGTSLYEIEIGIVVPALIYAPVWLAEQRGFLRDEGLSIRLRSFGSTDATTAALRDGVVPVTIGSPEGSIADALSGGDLRLVSGFINRPPLSMIGQPRYHSIAELRGAKLGTTSLKEGTCHLMEKMMAAHGMYQPADFQFVMAGAHPQRWEALKAGTLDAAIQLVPFNYIAEEAGYPNLGNVDEYVPEFLFCAVCTRMKWANENRDRTIGLLRALRRGVEALYDDPAGAAAVVLDRVNVAPHHARRACREFVSKKVIPEDLSINPQAFAATLDAMHHSGLVKHPAQAEVQSCIDLRFLSAAEA
jgi:ABC-type nitrate/sulfonate/bicarbonate transport system substrate-binding protein